MAALMTATVRPAAVLVSVTEEVSVDTDPGPAAVEEPLSVGAGLAASPRDLAGAPAVVRVENEIINLK